jgi:hypothetical protein
MSSSVSTCFPLNLVPLQNAVLCANCEVVSDSRNGHCIVCGSPSLMNLSRVLSGSEEGDKEEETSEQMVSCNQPALAFKKAA